MNEFDCPNCKEKNKVNSKFCMSCGIELPKQSIEESYSTKPDVSIEKENKNKKILGSVLGVIFFFLSYFGVQYFFFNSNDLIDKNLMNVASELNKTCPLFVDAETRLDNTIALPKKSFQYNYTLVNMNKDDINVEEAMKTLKPNIINTIKTNPSMKYYKENKVTMIYSYKDKNGIFIFKFEAKPEMYE